MRAFTSISAAARIGALAHSYFGQTYPQISHSRSAFHFTIFELIETATYENLANTDTVLTASNAIFPVEFYLTVVTVQMEIEVWSAAHLLKKELPPSCALIRFADSRDQFYQPVNGLPDQTLDIVCNDSEESFEDAVRAPGAEQAQTILQFFQRNLAAPRIVVQCQAGVGRSRAVAAAFCRLLGSDDYKTILAMGTHNRRLYRNILEGVC
jgi:predicted protein tyrosine phosphatase